MAEMTHLIRIESSAEKVFEALSTTKGLRGWWTADSLAEPRPGGKAEFGFYNRATVFRMNVTEFKPNQRLIWECVGDDAEWKGTRLTWAIAEEDGRSVVEFRHADWKQESAYFKTCNSTWGALMYRLKDYVEGKSRGPLFTH